MKKPLQFIETVIFILLNYLLFLFHHTYQRILTGTRIVKASNRADQNKQLLEAAEKGHLMALESALAKGAEVNTSDKYQNTPLILAAKHGHYANVVALIQGRANVDYANEFGVTALMFSAVGNHEAIFRYLFFQRPNLLIRSLMGHTAVQCVMIYGHMNILSFLVANKVNLNQHTQQDGNTPLFSAVISNQLPVVKFLLKNGSHLDELNQEGQSALVVAKEFKRDNIYDYLKKQLNKEKKIVSSQGTQYSIIMLRLELAQTYYKNCHELKKSVSLLQTEKVEPKNKKTVKNVHKKKRQAISHNKSIPTISHTHKGNISNVMPITERLVQPVEEEKKLSRLLQSPPLKTKEHNFETLFFKPKPKKDISIILPEPVQEIINKLNHKAKTYAVGGCLRDSLLNLIPTDFDIVTKASMLEVKEIIGIGAPSKHINNLHKIYLDNYQIDIICDPSFDLASDANKRDFTCNALYLDNKKRLYDPLQAGLLHVQQRKVVAIGDTYQRFKEDAIRLLRLLRLVGQYQFTYDAEIFDAIQLTKELIKRCDPKQLQFELRKVFLRGHAVANFRALKSLNLLLELFPSLTPLEIANENFTQWVEAKLQQTDELVILKQPVSMSYIYALFQVADYVTSHMGTDTTNIKKIWHTSQDEPPQSFQFFQKVDQMSQQLIAELSLPSHAKVYI